MEVYKNLFTPICNQIIDILPVVFFIKDLEGKYIRVNELAAKLLGKPIVEVLEKSDRDFFPENVTEKIIANDQEIMKSGRGREDRGTISAMGLDRIYISRKHPLFNERGHVIGLIGVLRDITPENRIKDQYHFRSRQFAQIIHHLGDGILLIDGSRKIVVLNEMMKEITGLQEIMPIENTLDDVIKALIPEEQRFIMELIETIYKHEENVISKEIVHLKDKFGHIQEFSCGGVPIFDPNDEITGILLVFRCFEDIEDLDEFSIMISGIVHDFNNLFMIILGNLKIAETLIPEGGEIHGILLEMESALTMAYFLIDKFLSRFVTNS